MIVDRIMPGMDGIETISRLRAIRPALRTILASEPPKRENNNTFRHLSGMSFALLEKPYERETLARKVRWCPHAKPSKN